VTKPGIYKGVVYMLTQETFICKYNECQFSPIEEEKICNIAAGDIVAKLEMVKACMDLVVKLAKWYALENGVLFSQMVRVGVFAIIKAAESFDGSGEKDFIDYAGQQIVKAMIQSSDADIKVI